MAIEKIVVPDFGDVQEISVVEVYVGPGDSVEVETPLIALESEKAVMDVPSPISGVIVELHVAEDDTVKSGDPIASVEVEEAGKEAEPPQELQEPAAAVPAQKEQTTPAPKAAPEPVAVEPESQGAAGGKFHATPSVRAYARELGIELGMISPTGPKGRILKEDVQALVKSVIKGGGPASSSTGFALEELPLEDFSQYGPTEEAPLGRIKKISGPHLHRSWLTVPHVTHFDEADVTELEIFRKQINEEAGKDGLRFSPLVFIIKAVVATLKDFPLFNSSLVPGGENVVLKKYYNIGIAVDTPGGLVVPVIKEADSRGMRDLAAELIRLSSAARNSTLAIGDMKGATFTISSLGGIGGTAFTPIVNSPQVAILGLSRNYSKPVWDEEQEQFVPRLTLPFSLSYDHRVIDGADAARFCRALGRAIEDLRRALL